MRKLMDNYAIIKTSISVWLEDTIERKVTGKNDVAKTLTVGPSQMDTRQRPFSPSGGLQADTSASARRIDNKASYACREGGCTGLAAVLRIDNNAITFPTAAAEIVC